MDHFSFWAIVGSRHGVELPIRAITEAVRTAFYHYEVPPIEWVVSGGAKGIDRLAARWAETVGIGVTEILPEWDRFGNSAGYRRNETIVELGPSAMIAITKDKRPSKGTRHTMSLAYRALVPLFHFHLTEEGITLAGAYNVGPRITPVQ